MQVDRWEGCAREVSGAAQGAGQPARESREGRRVQVEGGARLHDGPRAVAAAHAVRRRHVPR